MSKLYMKFIKWKKSLSDRHIYASVFAVAAIMAIAAMYQYNIAVKYQNKLEMQYQRAFREAVDYVNNVDVSLQKIQLVNSPRQISHIASEIFRASAAAKSNLGQLPTQGTTLDTATKFLSQTGDFTYNLSRKVLNGESITDEEREYLTRLAGYASGLNRSLSQMQDNLYKGTPEFASFENMAKNYSDDVEKAVEASARQSANDSASILGIDNGFEHIQKEFQDYPELIYDGPFSDHLERAEAEFIKSKPEISSEDAAKIAALFLGDAEITFAGEVQGMIPSYAFESKKGEGNIYLEITKKGGEIMFMRNNRPIGEAQVQIEGAVLSAKARLEKMGFRNMIESYYMIDENSVTFNFAPAQDNSLLYPDLVKVIVALDNAEIIGVEAKGYIMCHKIREIPSAKISQSDARKKISPKLQIERVNTAMIPLDGGREAFCYEFAGKFNDRDFLIYINTQTGVEEQILLLLKSDNGILAI